MHARVLSMPTFNDGATTQCASRACCLDSLGETQSSMQQLRISSAPRGAPVYGGVDPFIFDG